MLKPLEINPNCKKCNGKGFQQRESIPCDMCWNIYFNSGNAPASRLDLLEMVIDFHFALEERQNCPLCYGYGVDLSVDDGSELEECECLKMRRSILDKHEIGMGVVIEEYLMRSGFDLNEIKDSAELIMKTIEELNIEAQND